MACLADATRRPNPGDVIGYRVSSVMTEDTTPVLPAEHEVIPFAVFLVYRARRMRAPVVEGAGPTPDLPTPPDDPTAPDGGALAMVIPISSRR